MIAAGLAIAFALFGLLVWIRGLERRMDDAELYIMKLQKTLRGMGRR